MRAKKKNQINFERKEKLIHKETMRFFNLLEIHSSTTINNQPYFPELYENVVNHIREYLANPEFEDNSLRNYIDDETNKIKNLFLKDNETEENNLSNNIESETTPKEIEYTQTIFDITTKSNEIDNSVETTNISDFHSSSSKINLSDKNTPSFEENHILTNNNLNQTNIDSEVELNQLKKIRDEKFSNLKVLSITHDNNKDFITLSEEPFFYKIFKDQNKNKFSILRLLKYLYLKRKRKFK